MDSSSVGLQRNGKAISLAALVLLALCACLFFSLVHPAVVHAATYKGDQVAWQVKDGKAYAKADGKKLKGLQIIDDKTYYFDKKGVQRTGWRKIKGSYYYFNIASKAEGYMVTSKVVCGVKLGENGAAKLTPPSKSELKVLMKANKLLDKLAQPAWSKQKKLKAAWKYVTSQRNLRYHTYRDFHNTKNWHHAFALDIFDKRSGSCYSFGAAFAYLAQAAGYKSCKVVSSVSLHHGWALIDGLVYDVERTFWHRYGNRYAVKGSYGGWNYTTSASYTATICPNSKAASSATSGKKKATAKSGLVKSGKSYYFYKNGKKVKSIWKTIKGKRYYFKSSGKAATGSYKVKGTYYVFNAKGQLLKGKKTREVTVGKNVYRVTKSGKAVKGWNSAKTKRYDKTGLLLTGVRVVSGKLYAADATGTYDADLTAKLRAAAVLNGSPAALLDLLGSPKNKEYIDSCQTGPNGLGGKDGIFEYEHVRVTTFLDTSGAEFLMGVEPA